VTGRRSPVISKSTSSWSAAGTAASPPRCMPRRPASRWRSSNPASSAAALFELFAGGPDAVMAQIARYQIACDAQQNGWIQPAHSPKALAETCGLDELPLATTDGVHRIAWQRVKTAAARVVFPVYQGIDRIGLS
jgi:hypothetical protein